MKNFLEKIRIHFDGIDKYFVKSIFNIISERNDFTEFSTFFFQVLIMNHNPMRTLPPRAFHLAGLINVQKVYMRNCSLDDLDPTALAGLVILIELDLSENNIYELKDGTFLVSCLNVNPAQCGNDRIFLLILCEIKVVEF